MKKIKRLSTTVALLALIAVMGLLTACGSSSSETSSSAKSGEQAKAKKVIVSVAAEEKPLSYTDDKGNLVGYEVDALKAIDKLIPEYDFDIQSVEADSQQIGLDSGKYALITEGLFKTKERQEKYLLPEENLGVSLIKIVVKGNDNNIKTLDDLVGKKVAPVSPNGGIYNLLTSYNNTHDKKIKIETQEGLSNADRFTGIASGKYDATVLPSFGFDELKNKLKLDLKQTEPVKVNYTYFVLGKDQKDLTEKVNTALKTIKSDGTLGKLAEQYFGEDIFKYKEN